jgi:hypothetical protein
MRKIPGTKGAVAAGLLAALACLSPQIASAQETNNVTNNGTNNNFQLPGVSLPQGTDEVRAADGTSCRSAVGGTGAYLDMGVIGRPNTTVESNSYYGRFVVPLGKASKRLDCSKLYELEIERLKLELELAKAGLGRSVDPEIDGTQTTALPESPELEAEAKDDTPQVQSKAEPEDDTPQVQSSAEPEDTLVVPEETAASEDDGSEVVVSAAAWGKASKVSQYTMADEKPVVVKAVAKKKVGKPTPGGIASGPKKLLKTKKTGKAAWADEGWSDAGLNVGGEE